MNFIGDGDGFLIRLVHKTFCSRKMVYFRMHVCHRLLFYSLTFRLSDHIFQEIEEQKAGKGFLYTCVIKLCEVGH